MHVKESHDIQGDQVRHAKHPLHFIVEVNWHREVKEEANLEEIRRNLSQRKVVETKAQRQAHHNERVQRVAHDELDRRRLLIEIAKSEATEDIAKRHDECPHADPSARVARDLLLVFCGQLSLAISAQPCC